jgi:nucleoside-diphosphate-sugar epimerase
MARTKTPFGEMLTPDETPVPVVKPLPPPPVVAPTSLKPFNWYGQRFNPDTSPTMVWPAVEHPVLDPNKPYPFKFTFDIGWVVDIYGNKNPLNILQYASEDTAKRVLKAMQNLMPDTPLSTKSIGFDHSGPVTTTIKQRVFFVPGGDAQNVGAIASMIMFNGWEPFKQWLKMTMEPQGIRVDTSVEVDVLG